MKRQKINAFMVVDDSAFDQELCALVIEGYNPVAQIASAVDGHDALDQLLFMPKKA